MYPRFWAAPFLISVVFLTVVATAKGASIEVSSVGSREEGLVLVTGPFLNGDFEQFQTKISLLSKAIVAFSSDGGNLETGIQIGRLIRLKGFLSLVPDGARCASACVGLARRIKAPYGTHRTDWLSCGVCRQRRREIDNLGRERSCRSVSQPDRPARSSGGLHHRPSPAGYRVVEFGGCGEAWHRCVSLYAGHQEHKHSAVNSRTSPRSAHHMAHRGRIQRGGPPRQKF